nr:MAG TPA: hypothetical protein [Caudoviricetes sp.]
MTSYYFLHSFFCFVIFSVLIFFGAIGYEYIMEESKYKHSKKRF